MWVDIRNDEVGLESGIFQIIPILEFRAAGRTSVEATHALVPAPRARLPQDWRSSSNGETALILAVSCRKNYKSRGLTREAARDKIATPAP